VAALPLKTFFQVSLTQSFFQEIVKYIPSLTSEKGLVFKGHHIVALDKGNAGLQV
jgi:hypothetical protein